MRKVINATGVVLHTNLGRAPLGKESLAEMAREIDGYCSLEFDLRNGERGERTASVERYLQLLCEAQAALVVNNTAAAVLLMLNGLARGKEVLISRGELVQIGGGFRIPDIMESSGALLREVGTTNITELDDYERNYTSETAAFLKVHHSNFFITGHTKSPSLSDLSQSAHAKDIACLMDLGSGALPWLRDCAPEIGIVEVLRAGVDVVCFSGDKLMGGPQAGIIVGKKKYIEALRKTPLYRALRLGKTELFLLESVLIDYLGEGESLTWSLLRRTSETLKDRAHKLAESVAPYFSSVNVIGGTSSVGGGAMPETELVSWLVEIMPRDADELVRSLLRGRPAIAVRRERNVILLDLRTILDDDEETAIVARLKEQSGCTS